MDNHGILEHGRSYLQLAKDSQISRFPISVHEICNFARMALLALLLNLERHRSAKYEDRLARVKPTAQKAPNSHNGTPDAFLALEASFKTRLS